MSKIIRPLEYRVENNKFIIVIEDCPLINRERYLLVLSKRLPQINHIYKVYIKCGDDYLELQDIVGNYVMSDQLNLLPQSSTGGIVRLIYGRWPKHFKVLINIPDSIYSGE
jgi:hypothetical protein